MSTENLKDNILDFFRDQTHFDALKQLHPDHALHISARQLEAFFMSRVASDYIAQQWRLAYRYWPRKLFQFYRRDGKMDLINPSNAHDFIATSIGQANLFKWMIQDALIFRNVCGHFSTIEMEKTLKTTIKLNKKQEKRTPNLLQRKKKAITKKQSTLRKQSKCKPKVVTNEGITDALDADIKPRLSSKRRSQHSVTFCTTNNTWSDMKKKDPNHKIKFVY